MPQVVRYQRLVRFHQQEAPICPTPLQDSRPNPLAALRSNRSNPPSKNQEKIAAHIVEIATADQFDVMRGDERVEIATVQKFRALLTGVLRTLS